MILRDYQQRAITDLYNWFLAGYLGNPCLVLPTGSGKSHIVAALCQDALTKWPETRVLMLTHVKELIEQNAEKMYVHWPDAPLGIYSAGIGRRELHQPITFAGIQSVRDKAAQIDHVDLVIIDECHLVNHKDTGGYRDLLRQLQRINPNLRVIGLTATPYRLGHGMITDEPAIFNALIAPVTVEELIFKKHLAPLRSKITATALDTTGVAKRGGEFVEGELQKAVNTKDQNVRVVSEVIALAEDRKHWLFFCTGVSHAENVCEILNYWGIPSKCVTGDTPKKEREKIIEEFKTGKIKALTNANVLTTGFDYPDIDLIAMLRPTMSPGLYIQMAGRGMRPKSHTDHCLVLDFAKVVATHGPITNVQPPKKGGTGDGVAPIKICDNCNEICALAARVCPACGTDFPAVEPKRLKLQHDDIMGDSGTEMAVTDWSWRRHVSQASGKLMVSITYYGGLSDTPITEYLPILHSGFAGEKALGTLYYIANKAQAVLNQINEVAESDAVDYVVAQMNQGFPPVSIEYKRDGKFYRVVSRKW
jgi:DNA repair protein RadD